MNLTWATDPVALILNMLAAFRITRLLVDDAFPFGVPRGRLVDWANKRWLDLDEGDRKWTDRQRRQFHAYDGQAPLALFVTCPWCMGVWVSVGVALLASTGAWWPWVAVPLALSAAVGIIASKIND